MFNAETMVTHSVAVSCHWKLNSLAESAAQSRYLINLSKIKITALRSSEGTSEAISSTFFLIASFVGVSSRAQCENETKRFVHVCL